MRDKLHTVLLCIVMSLLVFFTGLVVGNAAGESSRELRIMREAAKRGYAHYDVEKGELVWNEQVETKGVK